MFTVNLTYEISMFSSTVATIRVEPSMLVFLAFISKTVNSQCYYHTFLERSQKDLSKNVWVVASIVYRFRDNRKKHQHRRLNSYRGDYIHLQLKGSVDEGAK